MPEYAVISVLAAGSLCLMTCSSTSWTSPAIPKLKLILPDLTIEQESWLGSLVPFGAIFGPYFFSYLADKIGRKYTLLCVALPVTASYLLMTFNLKLWYIYLGRFLCGFSLGGGFAVLPAYVGEVSSAKNRGYLGATITVLIAGGILFPYAIGPYLTLETLNLVLAILPLTFFVLFLIVGVESPYFYVSANNMHEAKNVLTKIRNASSTEIDQELSEIKYITEKTRNARIWEIFMTKPLLKAEFICASLVFFHQGTGINAVISYSQEIFTKTGTIISSEVSSLICGSMLLLSTIISTFIIHKFQRRPIFIISTTGMVVSLAVLGIYLCLQKRNIYLVSLSFVPLLSLVSFIVTFNIGLGPLVWIAQGEFFPTDLRAPAGALNTSFCWLISFLVTNFFKPLAEKIGLGETFLILAGISILGVIFSCCCIIETKDKSLKEIQDDLYK